MEKSIDLARLYSWDLIAEKDISDSEAVKFLYDTEQFFYSIGIRCKIEEMGNNIRLLVSSKDMVWAKEYVDGSIKQIITEPFQKYSMFSNDAKLINPKLQNAGKPGSYCKIRRRTLWSTIIVIAFIGLVSIITRMNIF